MLEDPQENVLKLEKTIEITRKEIWKGVKQRRGIFCFIMFAFIYTLR